MGEETRATGTTMLLGPDVNIQRDPLGGRFFGCCTEDPLLDSRLAVAFVQGVQSRRVAACIKHFVCNNRESVKVSFDVTNTGTRAGAEVAQVYVARHRAT